MTLALRHTTPDDMGWALGRAIYEQTMTHYPEPHRDTWDTAHPHDRLWHARHAQWLLDHTYRGPGQWPTPVDLAKAQVEWFAGEYPAGHEPWENRGPDMQARDIEHATAVLAAVRTQETP